jgi:hypothetical protein
MMIVHTNSNRLTTRTDDGRRLNKSDVDGDRSNKNGRYFVAGNSMNTKRTPPDKPQLSYALKLNTFRLMDIHERNSLTKANEDWFCEHQTRSGCESGLKEKKKKIITKTITCFMK